MRICLRVLKWPLAALLLAAAASAAYAAASSQSVDVTVTIANNTTVAAGANGGIHAHCWGPNVDVDVGATQTLTCTVGNDEDLEVYYDADGFDGSIVIDCGSADDRPDFTYDSAVTLTFAGNMGNTVTMTQTCTGLG